jgi:tRNA-Thr(GGU) m(6)t(6)A37 methyltransferase TsaA
MAAITLQPVGYVRSPIADPAQMPIAGVPATVEILPEFAPALEGIEANTHLWVLAWLDRAERVLQTAGRRALPGAPPRGVFGLRSSVRPNPIGLTAARLLRRDGRRLELDRLDFVDGTPVLDLKRYSPGWDCIFSARTDRERRPPRAELSELAQEELEDLILTVERFHGEQCAGGILAARLVMEACRAWEIGPRDEELLVNAGPDGCLTDGLQAITGATLGRGRLRIAPDGIFALTHGGRRWRFAPWPQGVLDEASVRTLPLERLVRTVERHDSVGRLTAAASPMEMLEFPPAGRSGAEIGYLLNAIVVPRAIAWVSTLSPDGVANLAPHSYCTVASTMPPVVLFVSSGVKDTLRNIQATGEFVVNVVSEELAEAMNLTAADFPPQVSEFEFAGLEQAPSVTVRPPRVARSPAALECRLLEIRPVGDPASYVIFGLVQHIRVSPRVWRNGRIDPALLCPVGRLAGSDYSYTRLLFRMPRPRYADLVR